ncbi:MAG: serine/threonine protein kinase, partial [Planctomycetes bacterium]|nr:serine/threonine protein kinase [Planctomycetota bacterium]
MGSMVFRVSVLLFVASGVQAGEWLQFRGPGGGGVSDEKDVPLRWTSEENVRWSVALPGPGNNGSPIVTEDAVLIVVATDKGRRRSLASYDRKTGRERWVRTVEFEGKELTHSTSLYGGSTPAADGDRVVVWHSSAG